MVFGHTALAQILRKQCLTEFTVGIMKCRIIDNSLLNLIHRHIYAHHLCALFQVGTLNQPAKYGFAALPAACGLIRLYGIIQGVIAYFFATDLDDIVGAGVSRSFDTKADKGQRDQTQ